MLHPSSIATVVAGLAWLTGALSPAVAADVEASATGFGELRVSTYAGVSGTPVQVVERFRPTFEAKLGPRLALSTTVEAWLTQGRNTQDEFERTLTESELGPLLDAAGCTWPSDANEFFDISNASDYLLVDRLFLDWYHPKFDLRVGKQAVQWGSAQFINPTDPFPQVLFVEPWRFRAGLSVARVSVPFGKGKHDVSVIAGMDSSLRHPLASGRLRMTLANTDWALVGAYRGDVDDTIVGLDIRGTLGVGFWLESAVHVQKNPWIELAVGVDYSIAVLDTLLIMAQYYRNGNGDPTGEQGSRNLTDNVQPPDCCFSTDGLFPDASSTTGYQPPLSGRDYVLAGFSLGIIPELSANGFWLQNFDGTAFAIPTVTVKPLGWLDISLAAQLPIKVWGDGGEFRPSARSLELTVPVPPDAVSVDLSGLVPDATFVLWTRANF